MKKLNILIIAIAVICIITGSYAVYLGNGDFNDTDISPTVEKTISLDTIDNPDTDNNPSIDENNQNINNVQENSMKVGNTYKKVPGTYILINEAVDYTDMYILCPSCGGFVALGEVTKNLPEGAICPDLCGGYPTLDKDYLSTYEEAYAYWQENGDRCTEEGEIIDYHNPEHYNPNIDESGNDVEDTSAREYTPQIVADFTNIY